MKDIEERIKEVYELELPAFEVFNKRTKETTFMSVIAWEMGSIMLREDDERLLRHGVRVEGEITPESIVLHLEYRYKYMLESHGFDVKDFYEE